MQLNPWSLTSIFLRSREARTYYHCLQRYCKAPEKGDWRPLLSLVRQQRYKTIQYNEQREKKVDKEKGESSFGQCRSILILLLKLASPSSSSWESLRSFNHNSGTQSYIFYAYSPVFKNNSEVQRRNNNWANIATRLSRHHVNHFTPPPIHPKSGGWAVIDLAVMGDLAVMSGGWAIRWWSIWSILWSIRLELNCQYIPQRMFKTHRV